MILQLEHITKSFGSRVLFSDVTFRLEEYDRLALVGPNGAGKTTIVNLLMRFYDIDSGKIMISNQNLGEIARGTLRKNVVIVLQDTVLF